MIKGTCRKWKTIRAYNSETNKVTLYELDEKGKLIEKVQNQKRIPIKIKAMELKQKTNKDSLLNEFFHQERKMEISKNTIIFVRESYFDQNKMEIQLYNKFNIRMKTDIDLKNG